MGGATRLGAHEVTVAVLEEYVPEYRAPFFLALKQRAASLGIEVLICAGDANEMQTARGDSAPHAIDLHIEQREFRVLGRRVVLRKLPPPAKAAAMVISNQARRNLDLYRWLVLPRRLRRRRIAVWGHGVDHVDSKSRVDRWLLSLIVKRADWLFVYTQAGADAVTTWSRRVTVVNNSTDTTALRRDLDTITSEDRQSYAASMGLGPNVVLFVGGLDPSKRIDALVEACAGVASRLEDFECLVAGDGLLAYELAERSRTMPWLRLLGHVKGRELALAFDAACLIIMPGRVGLVAVDALTAGLPVVTLEDSQHAPEFAYLRDGSTVLVCGSVSEMTETITDVLGDQDRLERMRTECLVSAKDFSVETMADNFLSGIVSALDQH